MQMIQKNYDKGAEVVFRSVYGESKKTNQTAKILFRGNGADESGVGYCIIFSDGHQLGAYPGELFPTN